MPHELETFADGTTAFASARLSAWHQLGTVTQNTMKAEEIMAAARLGDWGVRTIPTSASTSSTASRCRSPPTTSA